MAIDHKYGKVSFEHGDIGEDEPIFVFREQDMLLPDVLVFYAYLCREKGSPQHHIDAIRASQEKIDFWQAAHHDQVRVPNSNKFIDRVSSGGQ